MSMLAYWCVGLFLAAEAVILFGVGLQSWPLLVAWALGALVVELGARLVHDRLPRVILAGLLVPICILLTFEGGLLFLPAAVLVLVTAVRSGHRGRPRHHHLTLHHGR